jgi:DNA-binding NarL/FixJ family response regulator
MKIKIAIADDHPLVIKGLQTILNNCPDMAIVGSYPNGEQLLRGIGLRMPDVLLLDIQMPGQTGDEIAEIIGKKYPKIKILVLTNFDSIYYINTMLRKNVSGYILKTTREEILLSAIRAVFSGGRYIEDVLQEKIAAYATGAAERIPIEQLISRREREVLHYIASDLTSQEIADKLFVSKRTVDGHRLSLLLKLDVKNVAALVKKGILLGLID